MSPLLAALLLTAAPAKTIAALDLDPQQVPAAVAKLVGTHLTQQLTLKGFQVLTSADLTAMIGVERQRSLAGCNEESSCLAEIGAALNASAVLVGSVGRLGEARLLNVKLLASGSAQSLAVCSGRASSDEGLLSEAERCVDIITAALQAHGEPRVQADAPAGPRRTWALAPLGAGVAAAIAGGIMVGVANGNAQQLTQSTDTAPNVATRLTASEGLANTGAVLLGVGGAAAVTGAILFFVRPPVQPIAAVSSQGAFVGIAGELP